MFTQKGFVFYVILDGSRRGALACVIRCTQSAPAHLLILTDEASYSAAPRTIRRITACRYSIGQYFNEELDGQEVSALRVRSGKLSIVCRGQSLDG
jgi:hypothetical protein